MKKPVRCQYREYCYLAEDLECYGYRTDCVLYLKSNDEPCSEKAFHEAVDSLITKVYRRHVLLSSRLAERKKIPDAQASPSK